MADFDCGASDGFDDSSQTLDISHMGWAVSTGKVEKLLKLDGTKYKVIMGFALGKIAPKNLLPAELQEKESPSSREMLEVIWKDL